MLLQAFELVYKYTRFVLAPNVHYVYVFHIFTLNILIALFGAVEHVEHGKAL